jgi:hypothetical protein
MQLRMAIVFASSLAFSTCTCVRRKLPDLPASLNAQSQAPDYPFHAQDSKCAPRDLLYHSPFLSQVLQQRLPTRISDAPLQPLYIPTARHIHPFLPQNVSKGHAHLPPSRIQKTPCQGFWCSEVHVLRLRFRFVRQDLACVHSFENLPAHEEVNGIQPALYTENTLSGILALRGSCSTSTDSFCQTGFGLRP